MHLNLEKLSHIANEVHTPVFPTHTVRHMYIARQRMVAIIFLLVEWNIGVHWGYVSCLVLSQHLTNVADAGVPAR